MKVRFGSVCSGIEAASVAWNPLGWEAAWFSEIEPFPCAVLKHHYPDVPNLGDMTTLPERILTGEVEAPDVFCGGTPCFTAGHMVLTDMGYKPIEEIKVGDLVVSHTGRLCPVLRVGNKKAHVVELKILGRDSLICTPDHPFLSLVWCKKRKLKNGVVSFFDSFTEPEWTQACQMLGRRWLSMTKYASQSIELPVHIFGGSCEKLLFFVGLWLGDGCFRKSPNRTPVTVLNLNQSKLDIYKHVIGTLGNVRKSREIFTVNITNKDLYEFLKSNFGEYSYGKRLPFWVLSHEKREFLLKGYFLTDGNKNDWGYKSASVSKSLALGIADLADTLGYVSNVHTYSVKGGTQVILGKTCTVRPVTEVRSVYLDKSNQCKRYNEFSCRKVRALSPLPTKETVFNIEVAEDHSYIVNGVITHNCQAFSIAGKRLSLQDPRAVLSLTFCEIVNAIDSVRSIQGKRPCVVFWENVPAVLSTKDNAFGCFLAALVGGDIPATTDAGRWPDAGFLTGPQRVAAWRVLDAQHFGLAQRRRRVFVVASAIGGGLIPQKYYLSARACLGILTRAKRRGKILPASLKAALEHTVQIMQRVL